MSAIAKSVAVMGAEWAVSTEAAEAENRKSEDVQIIAIAIRVIRAGVVVAVDGG